MWIPICFEASFTTRPSQEPHGPVDTSFDSAYLKTVPGIIKIAQLVLNLLGFICIEVTIFSYHPRGKYFSFVSMTGFWLTVFLLILYLFHNVEKFYKVPWLKIELFYCSLWASLYLIAACLAATFGIEAFSAAAFFGFCAMLMYCVEGFFKFKALRNGEPAQHPRPTITPPENTIPNTPPPPYK